MELVALLSQAFRGSFPSSARDKLRDVVVAFFLEDTWKLAFTQLQVAWMREGTDRLDLAAMSGSRLRDYCTGETCGESCCPHSNYYHDAYMRPKGTNYHMATRGHYCIL